MFEAGFEAEIIDDAVIASSEGQEMNLWEIREQMIPHQYFGNYKMLKWDVSVPLDRIMTFLATAEESIAKIGPLAIAYAVGQVGDKNIHLSAYIANTEASEMVAAQIYERIDALVWDFCGSIVAEHGVGSMYRDRVRAQNGTVEHEMLQRVKACFDPNGLFNPSKLVNL